MGNYVDSTRSGPAKVKRSRRISRTVIDAAVVSTGAKGRTERQTNRQTDRGTYARDWNQTAIYAALRAVRNETGYPIIGHGSRNFEIYFRVLRSVGFRPIYHQKMINNNNNNNNDKKKIYKAQ